MKHIFLSCLAIFITASASAQALESVVFNLGSSFFEKHYNFYENGLLKDIRKPDGTLLREFIYDDQQRVITCNTAFGTVTFSYDNQDHITAINGEPLYFYQGSGSTPDMYSTDPDITDDNILFSYYKVNDDLTLMSKYTNYMSDPEQMSVTGELYAVFNSEGNVQNLYDGNMGERTYRYLTIPNPMRAACMPASRVAYFLAGGSTLFEDALLESQFMSTNLDVIQGYYLGEDPESVQHLFELNDAGLPTKRHDRPCYLGVPEGPYQLSVTYTYQD
jgi:YD repeat-containing protein